jgi:hypothetical protein
MFKIEGLDKLQRDLKRVQDAISELDGDLGSVSFNPDDPESIDLAISSMEKLIDEKVAGFEDNDIVASLIDEMKGQYRALILEKAAEARLKEEE